MTERGDYDWHVVDRIARAFHEHYEELAPLFSYETRQASAVPWEDVPADNKSLMRAVVDHLLRGGVIVAGTGSPPTCSSCGGPVELPGHDTKCWACFEAERSRSVLHAPDGTHRAVRIPPLRIRGDDDSPASIARCRYCGGLLGQVIDLDSGQVIDPRVWECVDCLAEAQNG